MKINDIIYKTPEMSEEKLLELINKYKHFSKYFEERLLRLHKSIDVSKAILSEWDVIQEKKSYLTKGERDKINALVSFCLVRMTKDEGNK